MPATRTGTLRTAPLLAAMLIAKRTTNVAVGAPKRARVRIPLDEAISNATQQLSGLVRLARVAPNFLYVFVPLAYVRDAPAAERAGAQSNGPDASDADAGLVGSGADTPDDSDADTGLDDSDADTPDDSDADEEEDGDALIDGLVDEDDADADDDADAPADGGASAAEEPSSDDDYASDWGGDSDDSDDSGDDSDDSGDDDSSAVDDDDVVDIGQGVGVDANHVPTLYTTFEAALTAGMLAHRSRRAPLQGVMLMYRQYKKPLKLRCGQGMLAQHRELGAAGDDEDDGALAAPIATAAAGDDDDDDDGIDADDDDGIDAADADADDDDEDRLTAPAPAAAARAGRMPVQPFPCQRAMIFYIRRHAEGNPACTEGEFAAMYADCPDGGNGWIDVDRNGTACVRMHWDSINEMMVRAGMTIIDADVIQAHLDATFIDPVSGEPLATDEQKWAVLRAVETD